MFKRKTVDNQQVYRNYSIYNSFTSFRLRSSENCKLCQNSQCQSTISATFACLALFSNSLLSQISLNKLIVNIIAFGLNYWNLCYFITKQGMHQKRCNVSTETDKERSQVVQLLKNDIIEDQSSDENEFDTIHENTLNTKSKTKKSIFALIKKKRIGRSKMKITKKIETCSTINFDSDSRSSNQELVHYQISEMTQCPYVESSSQSKKNRNSLLQKFMHRTKSNEQISNKRTKALNYGKKVLSRVLTLSNFVATTFIPKYNTKLIEGMKDLEDILHNLHHSEEHVIYILKRYIGDLTFQQQLMNATMDFFAIHNETKSQVHILADKLWYQQVEITKSQDYNLQKRLDFLVKTNRTLELQIETLCRQCEKLASRTNLYPKRFLHMRSFGKIYARQLIDNNRKLQNKVKALTGVIGDFENELEKSEQQKVVMEEEKRNIKRQVSHLNEALQHERQEYQLGSSKLTVQLSEQNALIGEAVVAVQAVFHDLREYDKRAREQAIAVSWPNLQYENACLPEMIYQLKACIEEFFITLFTAYKGLTLVVKDINMLRHTNARLQENLQKSTSELDSLSKKLEKNEVVDVEGLQSQYRKLEHENFALKLKLETVTEQNNFLREEIEIKKLNLNDTKASVNEMLSQNRSFTSHLDQIVQDITQLTPCEICKEFSSVEEKIEYLRDRYNQAVAENKQLLDKCNRMEAEHQLLSQAQESYQQDLATLQDGLTVLSAENDNMKKQLITEHQTVATLQHERVKYLEEKNLLKTIFQHLKGEVSRIQQLEGAVADMSKETNRLSLIAEFNKQLGEQLKNEVEVKENTIMELRQSLEKLSHLQIDCDKERMTLNAQLCEIASVKDKLTNCLENELKKNVQLDESKKKLECSTKSQLKLYEEMQKNERAALRELLKDFKNLIKQRDCLIQIQEENNRKYKELEKRYSELNKQYESSVSKVLKREDELRRIVEKVEEEAERRKLLEENHNMENLKHEKSLRKIEKLLGQYRNEKKELETSVTHLTNNVQKLQSDLDQSKAKASEIENQLLVKSAECVNLETENNRYKNELQLISKENSKLSVEIDYLKKMSDQKIIELKETISRYSTKDNMYFESQTTILAKEQQVNELNKIIIEKDSEVKRREQEMMFMKKQIDDQNKIMIGYENQLVLMQDIEAAKIKVEKELNNVQLEHKSTMKDLENSKKEIENLKNEIKSLMIKNENEKSFYKNQTSEILCEYSEQKSNIEQEIDIISNQLRVVTENLNAEKTRFEELAKSHEDLQIKYHQVKERLSSEVTAHKETVRKIEGMDNVVKAIALERDHLQQQVHMLLIEVDKEKNYNLKITNEHKKLQMILEQGSQQYNALEGKNSSLEELVKELQQTIETKITSKDSKGEIDKIVHKLEEKTRELRLAKETIESLKKELDDSQRELFDVKEELFHLQQQLTGLEFKNCELTLQLHESQAKLETERNLYNELGEKSLSMTAAVPSEGTELYY